MSDVTLRGEALRWGTVGVVLAVLAVAVASWQDVPLLLLGMVLVGGPLLVVPLLVGITDEGIEAASSGARLGRSMGDPSQYNPGSLPIPNKLEVVFVLCGVGLAGIGLVTLVG